VSSSSSSSLARSKTQGEPIHVKLSTSDPNRRILFRDEKVFAMPKKTSTAEMLSEGDAELRELVAKFAKVELARLVFHFYFRKRPGGADHRSTKKGFISASLSSNCCRCPKTLIHI